MTFSVRDYQIRVNSLGVVGTSLTVDGMNGPKTREGISAAMVFLNVDDRREIFDDSRITRVHWHWTVTGYEVTPRVTKHYNGVFDYKGNEFDGRYPPLAQADYGRNYGVSHTLMANTGAVGLSIACMAGVKANWGSMTVDQGKYPITWEAIDAMLEKTAELCEDFDIRPSMWTTLNHAEVQGNIGIRQKGKWDICILPDNPTKILNPLVAGNIMRARMIEKFM